MGIRGKTDVKAEETLMLLILIGLPLLIAYLTRKINQRITKREVEIVIITDSEHYSKKVEAANERASIDFGEKTYAGTLKDAWELQQTFIEKIKGIHRYLLIFYEFIEDKKLKAQPEIKPINKAIIPKTSADILMKIKKYRGVNPALESQFKEQGKGLPNWLLVVALLAVMILGLLAAVQIGLINLPTAGTKLLALMVILQ